MLKVRAEIVRAVRQASDARALYPYLQGAIELEHSTIPPYLTAYYSLKPGLNDEIGKLLRSVVIEEMVHMTIACNILVSLGGSPNINGEGFVPDYPGPLPMGIGGDDFIVHIAPFSLPLVRDTFMVIEEPEHPVDVSEADGTQAPDDPPAYKTIGDFYEALKSKLTDLPASAFGRVDKQVLGIFDPDQIFAIVDAESACRAIDVILVQGEGTSTDPFESPGEPAHYYRFGEIYYGSKLTQTSDGFAYGGAPIAFVTDGVFPMKPDPRADQFAEGTYGRLLSDTFTEGYATLLNALHAAFNGEPDRMNAAIGLMYQLRLLAQRLMQTPLVEGQVATAGPVWG